MSLAFEGLRLRNAEDPMVYLDDFFRYAMARLRIREDAEDVAIEVVQSLPNPCARRELRIYMLGMARRKVADRLRSRRPLPTIREVIRVRSTSVERAWEAIRSRPKIPFGRKGLRTLRGGIQALHKAQRLLPPNKRNPLLLTRRRHLQRPKSIATGRNVRMKKER